MSNPEDKKVAEFIAAVADFLTVLDEEVGADLLMANPNLRESLTKLTLCLYHLDDSGDSFFSAEASNPEDLKEWN